MSRLPFLAAAAAALLLAAGPALAQHPGHGASGGTPTANLQGDANDTHAFVSSPHMKAFYELSKATLGPGAPKLDFEAYRQKSFVLFGELGKSFGMKPEAMQDHLKLIPGQVVQIVKEDPHVLDSYDKFIEAMIGPP